MPEEEAELLDNKIGDAVFTKVREAFELGVRVNIDDIENDTNTVAVTEIAALDVPEFSLDDEITDEPVAI